MDRLAGGGRIRLGEQVDDGEEGEPIWGAGRTDRYDNGANLLVGYESAMEISLCPVILH